DHIDLEFDVGQCIQASYTAPTTGRTSVNIVASDGTVVLHVDYRKHWGGNPSTGKPWQNILIINSKLGGSWGTEEKVHDVETTIVNYDYTQCGQDADFSLELNQKDIATYAYRSPVNTVSRVQFDDQGYDAVLRKLCVVYPAPSK
uniref:Galectin b n=1 Tax=Aplysina lactuca TaxID=2911866 RepID=LEG2_APLLA|nr:RecName: Full=Galectin b; Short=Gal-b; AltName: Full=Aplysina lactuca lectin b; Short=ALL-b; AltName: Full=Beta-galactoside-binding lectin b [Aplysina lactuca]